MNHKHRKVGYFMLAVTLAVLGLFLRMYITAANEPPSVDSGTNFAVTALMVVIICILAYFTWRKLKK